MALSETSLSIIHLVTLLKMALSETESIDNSSSVTLHKVTATSLSSPNATYSTLEKTSRESGGSKC
jgi:hypothetical protein